ncbi:MAG: L-2-amino-thiazoline-4-carboxylic acid hydrolase [Solobacterium sp.]|nr:L-2-amino-thiazoline-4-carboxylic acid hydrolase [Solobacterium sp.]
MKEKDLPFDRSKHAVYTKNAKKCVYRLLRKCYGKIETEQLWEKIQLKYCEYLRDEPAMGGCKLTVSIYDPILIFAWHETAPLKPDREEIQQEIYDCFMGTFTKLGKVFNLNRRTDNRLAAKIFKAANDLREEEIKKYPGSFRMGSCDYDRENGIIRYSFTQCPNAEFAKRHHLEHVLPLMCNCDHMAMEKLHAALIREGTCVTSDCCDYCIVGDQNELASEYTLAEDENGLWLSVKKEN